MRKWLIASVFPVVAGPAVGITLAVSTPAYAATECNVKAALGDLANGNVKAALADLGGSKAALKDLLNGNPQAAMEDCTTNR